VPTGWVAYAVTAVVSAIGENKLMPLPDNACKVINAKSGYVRDNASWILGRVLRDYGSWMDGEVRQHLDTMLERKWRQQQDAAEAEKAGSGTSVIRPYQVGLCVSVYRAAPARPGSPGYDAVYYSGFGIAFLQLGIAAIPCGIFGDWSILLVTATGIALAFTTGSLNQWRKEKWACRRASKKTVVLTRGNGAQHAIVVRGDGVGFDLEDLAAGTVNVDVSASNLTRITVITLALLWILLLVSAAGIKSNTWFLLGVGGIGILQNVFVAGWRRTPAAFGMPLIYETVIGETGVMATLFAVEERYPGVGLSMRDTFFPGKLRPDEVTRWNEYAASADA
jgi:hypothetical protein